MLRTCRILGYVSIDQQAGKSTAAAGLQGAYSTTPGLETDELRSLLRRQEAFRAHGCC